jgi:hypothetical protein
VGGNDEHTRHTTTSQRIPTARFAWPVDHLDGEVDERFCPVREVGHSARSYDRGTGKLFRMNEQRLASPTARRAASPTPTNRSRPVSYDSRIGHLELTPDDYEDFIRSPFVDERLAGDHPVSIVLVCGEPANTSIGISSPGSLPVVVAWIGTEFGGHGPANADVVIDRSGAGELTSAVERSPIAAATLAVLLRSQTTLSVHGGLAAESAAYSVLQSGPEFAAWRATVDSPYESSDGPVVTLDRSDDQLVVSLDRPHRHNAVSTQLRDELHAALATAVVDSSIRSVILRGNGPSFCSGGDLSEFGARSDPASAHITRLARSPGRLIHRLGQRLEAHIHGSTLGGGIEMAAFAGHVVARPMTRIALPEIGLGLIPGAGGTVSMSRRIGRQRTAALGLTGRAIDEVTALEWGLIDEISD